MPRPATSTFALLLTTALALPQAAMAGPLKPKPLNKPRPGMSKPGSRGSASDARTLKHRLAGKRPTLENDSLLGLMLRDETPKKKGAPSAFSTVKIEVTGGKRVALRTLASEAAKPHRGFKARIVKAPKAVFGAVETSTEVYEFAHSFVIVQSTGVTVSDPAALKKAAPEFTRLADGRKHKIKQSKLTAESRAGLAAFKKEVAGYPAAHPLKKAAKGGDQALLDALASGVGRVEVVDTLHIPKRAPKLTAAGLAVPKIKGGHVDFGSRARLRPVTPPSSSGGGGIQIADAEAGERLAGHVADAAAGYSAGGAFHQTREFVAGNTWAEGWVWERRWNVPSGYLRITLGANYAFGLRVPIKVDTQMSPAWSCDDGHRETKTHPFRVKVRAEAVNGDEDFYRRAGMDEDKVAGGQELVLGAGVGYGVRMRLLWKTLVNRPYTEASVDWGEDFDPPQGKQTTKVADIFLPASATKTAFSIGPLTGWAKLGFRVDVSGKVRARVVATQRSRALNVLRLPPAAAAVSGAAKSPVQRLTLSNNAWNEFIYVLTNRTDAGQTPPAHYKDPFGFTVDKVEYDSRWSVVPGVKVHARAEYAGYGIRGTWEYWLESARLPIGSLKLGRHPGTRSKHSEKRGEKIWHTDTPGDTHWCRDNNPTV